MKIDNLRTEPRNGLLRVAATVRWEALDRPDEDVYFEVPPRYGHEVAPRAEAFVGMCAVAAMRHGEERIAVDGEICPRLRAGLGAAMAWLCRWNPARSPVRIEARSGCGHAAVPGERSPGALLSGGVDSLALVRANHLSYPPGHPSRITTAIVLRGVWSMQPEEADDRPERLDRAVASLLPATRDAGLELVPVFTNVQNLIDRDMAFWQYEYQGAALAAVGHVFADRLNALSIASTWDVANLRAWGSHPLLDHHYGSHDLRVEHELEGWTRMDKLRILAQWDASLEVLRVCNRDTEGDWNCGRCEKCLRTMLALVALGALERTKTFHDPDVSVAQLTDLRVPYRHVEGDYREIAELLRQRGRTELAEAIARRIAVSRVARAKTHVGRRARALDAAYLRGSLFMRRDALQRRRTTAGG